ncbi:hypothetical protein BVRB_2g042530 [Beta vulgaris subsp. vulgaris]|nr:hypothetical protein BVRB_2g042530 [Beta vulgaris subsp. vulgaris]
MKQSNMELTKSEIPINSASTSNDDLRPSSSESDFGFAFNDSNFSDRILMVEIIPDLPDINSDCDGCTTIADWAKNRKLICLQ